MAGHTSGDGCPAALRTIAAHLAPRQDGRVPVRPAGVGADEAEQRRPHILLIMADQLRADCLGVAGHPALAGHTPNLDRLAAEGTHFTHCCTTSPLCVPARMSLATSLYPHSSNLWQQTLTLPLDADTYMHRLRDAGFSTCSVGKNHLYPMENCKRSSSSSSSSALVSPANDGAAVRR